MPLRKVLVLLMGAVLLGVLAVAVARDRPPTMIPYPGRFVVATNGGISYLVDRWTGRLYALRGEVYYPATGLSSGVD